MRSLGQAGKDDHGSGICVLEAHDDVYDETLGTPMNPAETSGENATDEDVVALEVTQKMNRLKTLGTALKAPSDDELMLRGTCTARKPTDGWMTEWWQKVANESFQR